MDAILHYYFRIRIENIQSVSIGETVSAEDIRSVNVSKEILEILNTSFEIRTKSALLKNKKLINVTQSKMETLLQRINTSQETQGKNEKFDDIMALAITYFNMGLGYCDTELQKLDIGIAHFTTCLELLKGKELEPKAIMTVIQVLNELHIISYKCKQSDESYSFLDTAIELYSRYTKEEIEYPDPINFNAVLSKILLLDNEEDSNSKIALENLQLTTLLNMSRLYNKKRLYISRNNHKFIIYVHNILKQIMEKVSIFYVADWVITSAYLSQYFTRNHRFTEARNHIITAEYMIKKLYQDIEIMNNEKNKSDLYTNIRKAHDFGYNTVIKFWGLYGTELLIASADRLLPREKVEVINKSCEKDNSKSELFVDSEETFTNLLIFSGIEGKKQLLKNCTAQFSDKFVSNLKDAKTVFVEVLKCFSTANKYFTLEEHMVDFIKIKIESSKVYNSLAAFHQDKKEYFLLYTKGREILEDIMQVVNDVQVKSCGDLFDFQFNIIILKKILKLNIPSLNMDIEHLLLNNNVEQLDKNFEYRKDVINDYVEETGEYIETMTYVIDKLSNL